MISLARRRRGQFLIITSLLMAIILASVIAYVYNSQTFYLHFRYEPINEIIESVTADFKRALAYILANATHTYLNESNGPNARHNFTIGRLYAYEFLSKWKIYTIYAYKNIGLQVDFEIPNKTIVLHDRIRNITNLVKCYWYYPESLSMAYAMLKLNITKYSFYGWKANITVGLRAWIIESSFKSDRDSNKTSFKIRVMYDNNTQYPWLYEKGNITIYYPDPVRYGEWRKANIINVQYLGNSVYNITIQPYLKLFQGAEHSVAPLKVILKDERGIIVQLYSYKWIQLKIKRNTPDALDYKLVYDFNSGTQGWYTQNGYCGEVCTFGGGTLYLRKLFLSFKSTCCGWLSCSEGTVYLYSPKIYRAKYNDDFIEKFKKLEINVIFKDGCNCRLKIISDTGEIDLGYLDTGFKSYNLESYNIGSYLQLKIICTTRRGLLGCLEPATLILDDITVYAQSFKISNIPEETYTLDFDWYLNLYWNGVNLGLTDIIWDFEGKREGWFIVPQQPFLFGGLRLFAINTSLDLEESGGNSYLKLEFFKNPELFNIVNLPFIYVWLNLYSPIICINTDRLKEYNNLTLWYKVDFDFSKTYAEIRLQTFDKYQNLVTLDSRTLSSTVGESLRWNLSNLLSGVDTGKIACIWIDIYVKTKTKEPQYIWIDNVTLTTKRALVVPVPTIPVKNFRVNLSDVTETYNVLIPSQYELWNNVNWHGWNISIPIGLADFQVNFNSSVHIVFQLSFNLNEREKNIRIWWCDDLDSQPLNWKSNIKYENSGNKQFIVTSKLKIQLIDDAHPYVDKLNWDYHGVVAILVEYMSENNVTNGLYDLHAFKGWWYGYYRPKGNWTLVANNYPAPYDDLKAPIRVLAFLNTNLVGPYDSNDKSTDHYATLAILEVADNITYIPVITKVFWMVDKSILQEGLMGYWLYMISSKSTDDYVPEFFEIIGEENMTKVGKFADISDIEYIRDVKFIHSQWSENVCISTVLNFATLRTAYILYINQDSNHPPPISHVRERNDKYFLGIQIKPTEPDILSFLYCFLSVKKYTALSFTPIIMSNNQTDGIWVYSYLYTSMFLEPYMPTFNVSVSSP